MLNSQCAVGFGLKEPMWGRAHVLLVVHLNGAFPVGIFVKWVGLISCEGRISST